MQKFSNVMNSCQTTYDTFRNDFKTTVIFNAYDKYIWNGALQVQFNFKKVSVVAQKCK